MTCRRRFDYLIVTFDTLFILLYVQDGHVALDPVTLGYTHLTYNPK
jgi:hypothetical protein